jgi:RNA-directed DNA polymerase
MKPVSLSYEWKNINWRKVERNIFKLQKRIYRASQRGNVKLVHRLQRLLFNSQSAKLLAIRRVTQDNQGKKTAGIDGIKNVNPKQRIEMVDLLKLGNKSKPTRRVWIPKSNSDEKRPLGIPTMFDRALQALVKLGLEPEWEARFESNSYGFRPGRNAHDAIQAIYIAINKKAKYVLDADICKCFDKINHEKLLNKLQTFPSLRKQVKAWLKSGVMNGETLFHTEEGTPQGGVISPLLANIALHGMENRIKQFAKTWKGKKRDNMNSISLIRYADDFVVTHSNLEVILQVKEILNEWLAEMGLELKPSKTKITHTLKEHEGNVGFDFLGFNIRQYKVGNNQSGQCVGKKLGFKTLIKPSEESISRHTQKLKKIIREHISAPQVALIKKLNPVIRGWTKYYSAVVSRKVFEKCDHINFQQLWKWTKRRHPNKNSKWIANKYWHTIENQKWTFCTNKGLTAAKHSDTPIVRYIKVKGEASPFDGNDNYWASRMGKHPEMSNEKASLLKRQKGKCNLCGLTFKDGDKIETDHIIPTSQGGRNNINNKQLLHRHCHDLKTAQDIACTHDKSHQREERNEGKPSRCVLKTSQRGDSLA